MAADLATARRLARLGSAEEALLNGRDRPIVLAPRRPGAAVAAAVAPGSADLGLMLPYSPLHHLLLGDAGGPLVMTSGNVSDEPIAHRDEDALERLAGIADLFLLHDRPIATRTDDSVVRPVGAGGGDRDAALARAGAGRDRPAGRGGAAAAGVRGGAQEHLLPGARPPRVGGPPHRRPGQLGDAAARSARGSPTSSASSPSSRRWWSTTCTRTTSPPRYALEREGVETVAVPHHHAHLAACLAEHGWRGLAVGAIYDGAGLGPDGTVWGGEILAGDLAGSRRAAHLRTVRLPGGDAAAREPWRMACAWLQEAAGADPEPPAALAGRVDRGDLGRRRAPGPLRALAGHQQRRPPLRRRRRDLRPARPRRLRGPGRDRARGRVRPGRARRVPHGGPRPAGGGARARRRTSPPGGPPAPSRRASTTASRRRPPRRWSRRPGPPARRSPSCRAASSRTGACWRA